LVVGLLADMLRISPDSIGDEASLDGALQLESVAFVELQVTLEDELEIVIDPVEVVERNQLGSIVEYVHSLIAAA
jgi:acyl carrier protein